MRRALITGASGFVGAAVARQLAAAGTLCIGATRQQRQDNAALRWHPFDPARGMADACRRLLDDTAPEVIFHCAGATVAPPDVLDAANVAYADALLRAAALAAPAPPVVLIGSAAEYGAVPRDLQPVPETMTCAPQTAYARSKLRQTALGLAAAARGQPVAVARLFNLVGPGMHDYLAIGRFARCIAALPPEGGRLTAGRLDGERDIIGVGEAARLIAALGGEPRAYGKIVNICTGIATATGTLLDALIRRSGRRVEIEHDPALRGVSRVDRLIGSPARLASFGLVPVPPDIDAEMAAVWAAARSAAAV